MKSLIGLALAAYIVFGGSAFAADDPSIKGDLRANIKAAMMTHVSQTKINGDYVIFDAVEGGLKRLALKELHEGIVKKGDFYVSCADFEDVDGNLYDIDFLVAESDNELRVMQALVHKINDDKRKYHVENE